MALWEAVHGRYGPLNMEIKYHAFRKYEASLRKIEHKGAKASDARIMKCIKKFAFFVGFTIHLRLFGFLFTMTVWVVGSGAPSVT